jgi:hypothetical protein
VVPQAPVSSEDVGIAPVFVRAGLAQNRLVVVNQRPDEPTTWEMDVFRRGSSLPASIVFGMFTEQEGRSDLTLDVDLVAGADGAPLVRFGNLHVN